MKLLINKFNKLLQFKIIFNFFFLLGNRFKIMNKYINKTKIMENSLIPNQFYNKTNNIYDIHL